MAVINSDITRVYVKKGGKYEQIDETQWYKKVGGVYTSEGSSFLDGITSGKIATSLVENTIVKNPLYTQLDYITMTGTQYFKTGVTSAVNSGFDIDFIMLNGHTSSPYYNLFGSRGTGTVGEFRIDTIPREDGTELKLGSNVYSSGIKGKYRNKIKLYNGIYTKPDGTQLTNLDASTIANYPREIYIGCINKDNSAYGNKASLQIYNWKMYTGTTLERDFWPVKRNSDGVIGLYDIVNSQFYAPQEAAVTGDGENISIPDTSQDYNIYNPQFAGSLAYEGLPKEYRRLQYIKSTGVEYIDTNLSAPEGFEVEIKINIDKVTGSWAPILGAHEPSAPYKRNFIAYGSNKKMEMDAGDKITQTSVTLTGDDVIKASNVKNNFYLNINGTNYDPTITTNSSNIAYSGRTLHLLHNNGYDIGYTTGKVYYCKITVGGVLVRNFVPVARLTDNKIGLYDTINGVFYTNPGLGEFNAGPTLIPSLGPISGLSPYKELEYIKTQSSTGNNIKLQFPKATPNPEVSGMFHCILKVDSIESTQATGDIGFGFIQCHLFGEGANTFRLSLTDKSAGCVLSYETSHIIVLIWDNNILTLRVDGTQVQSIECEGFGNNPTAGDIWYIIFNLPNIYTRLYYVYAAVRPATSNTWTNIQKLSPAHDPMSAKNGFYNITTSSVWGPEPITSFVNINNIVEGPVNCSYPYKLQESNVPNPSYIHNVYIQ